MIYLQLFWSFFQIGIFAIGGGYAAMPLIQHQTMEIHSWLTMTEFTDLITISEMTPGPIAINSATFVGTRVAGLGGAVMATLGFIVPSCIMVSLLAMLYFRYRELDAIQGILGGLRPAIVAFIAFAALTILVSAFWGGRGFRFNPKDVEWLEVLLFAAAFVVLRKFRPNPILVLIATGLVGGGIYLLL